jgi:hypothetical protein
MIGTISINGEGGRGVPPQRARALGQLPTPIHPNLGENAQRSRAITGLVTKNWAKTQYEFRAFIGQFVNDFLLFSFLLACPDCR